MATLEQIQRKLKQLQAQADALIAKRMQGAIADIRKLMDDHGLTIADIDAHFASGKHRGRRASALSSGTRKSGVRSKASAKGKLPPKYRDPVTGATWSGHARPPAWIKDAKDRSKFLIAPAGNASADDAGKAKGAKGKSAAVKTKATAKRAIAVKTRAKKVASKKSAARKVSTAKPPLASKGVAAKKSRGPAAKKAVAKKAAASKKAVASTSESSSPVNGFAEATA